MDGALQTDQTHRTRLRPTVTPCPAEEAEQANVGHILAIAHRRDRAAFTLLFARFAPRIKTFLMRRGASDATAEELAQETMLAVWRKAERFDPSKGSAEAWIFTIARNAAIDAGRRQLGLASARLELENEPPGDKPVLGDEALVAAQSADRLTVAMRALPGDQVEVLRLAFFEDISHSEIASRLHLPLGTVKSRLRLAVQRLRGLVEDLR